MSSAYYLSLLDYTTLGCEYDLPVNWRLLEGMIAISGLMTFAWSTGVLFALAQEFHLFAPDLPGFGLTPRPDWMRNMDDYVLYLRDLLDALNLPAALQASQINRP